MLNKPLVNHRARAFLFFFVVLLVIVAAGVWWRRQSDQTVPLTIARLNECRRLAGLEPVELDAQLSEGCRLHVTYLRLNAGTEYTKGLNAHTENPQGLGYTEAGLMAANNSVIAFRVPPQRAVDLWMATLYHRLPLLAPGLRRVGLATDGSTIVMDTLSGNEGSRETVVAYPGNGQVDVPREYAKELPDPIPAGSARPAGFPITIQFPGEDNTYKDVRVTLTDGSGKNVATHLSDPENPATAFPQQDSICAIPIRPLEPGMAYEASVTARVNGKAFSRRWVFTTL